MKIDGVERSVDIEIIVVCELIADRIAVSETVTDLAGRIISNPAPGSIVIITTKYDDGSTKTAKRLIK